jgi:hypothetical protein
MTRTIMIRTQRLAVVLGLLTAGVAGTAHPASADAWADQNCNGGATSPPYWKRSHASSYAQPPLREGYLLDGGCYKLNDRDDTPALAADGGGEGTDCSGFVFRVWALKTDGSNGYRRWDYTRYIHGPWYSWHYKDPKPDDPFRNIPKDVASTAVMDAIAWYRDGGSDRHIALLWDEGRGSDYFIHAHTNTTGVEISEEIYRQIGDTEAVTRRNWSLECEPKCPTPGVKRRG